ncbi:MAG: retropepsin-like aspartic protease [Henriciella sp.]|uniref:retroviral-like aspartic protease family protein n=1 Tax=Henriciella sp. TaxID=1968823 RepID=UPI003C760D42
MRLTSFIAMLALLPVVFLLPAEAAQKQTIPFEITDSGHLIVKMEVNGHLKTIAVLDTGATFPIIHHHTAKAAAIAAPTPGRLISILGLGGIEAYPVVDVSTALVGDLVIQNFEAAYNARFYNPGRGNIIPASSLPYRVLDFDFDKQRIEAYDARPRRVRASTSSKLPITRIHALPFVKIKVQGEEAIALIDTGASMTMVNSKFASRFARDEKSIRTIEVVNAGKDVEVFRLLASRNVVFGDFRVRKIQAFIVDPPVLDHVGLTDQAVMIIGLDLLSQFRLQLDREEEVLWMHRPQEGVHMRYGRMFD